MPPWREFLRDFVREWREDNLTDTAAMMTYYAIFAMFPMVVFVLTFTLLILPGSAVDEALAMALEASPASFVDRVREQAANLQESARGGIAFGSAALALWGASRGTVSLSRALNNVFDVQETRPFWKVQLIGIAATVVIAALVIAALSLLYLGTQVTAWARAHGAGRPLLVAWLVVRWGGAGLLVMFIWALLFKFLPNTTRPLHIFTPGAVIGVLLWVAASVLFALYVKNFGKYDRTYGTLGAIIIFLTWLWLTNLAMLVGAEVNDVLHVDEELERAPREKLTS
jgi:membrane protein